MFDFFDTYSVKSLRYRARKLPECPYKLMLTLVADQLEAKKIAREEAKKIIEWVRTGDTVLLTVAVTALNLDSTQRQNALDTLSKMSDIHE